MSQENKKRSTRHHFKGLKELLKNFVLPPQKEQQEGQPIAEDIPFIPDTLAAFFLRPPKATFMIVRGTLILLIVAIVWASLSNLDEITKGEGKVIPSGRIQVIQNLEGGIVKTIPVTVGQIVKKGQVVLKLDETRFASSAGESKVKRDALFAKITRLEAEASGKDFLVDPEFEKESPKIVAEEKALYDSRKQELDATLNVLKQQYDERRSSLSHLQRSFALSSKELTMTRPLADEGVISQVELMRLERQVNDLQRDMETARLSIPESKSKLEGAQAKFRAEAARELAMARAEFAGSTATGVAVEDRLARTTVRSPVNGIVKTINVTTIGGVIQPGMEVMEIVPIEDRLLVEVKVRPADIGFLRVKQPATVKISAYDYSIYGGLDAEVENITADSITDEKGNSFYLVKVRTDKNFIGSDGKQLTIMPGMLATASIRTGKKSVLSYILKPLFKTKQNALTER